MKSLFSRLNSLLELMAAVLGLTLVVVAFVQVASRYVLGHAYTWPEEVCGFLFMWCSLIGMVVATATDAHLRVDAVVTLFRTHVQIALKKLSYVVLALFSLLMIGLGAYFTWDIYDMEQYAIALPIPIYLVVAGIPITFFLNFLFSCINVVSSPLEEDHTEKEA